MAPPGVAEAFSAEQFNIADSNADSKVSFTEFVNYHNHVIDFQQHHEGLNWAVEHARVEKGWEQHRIVLEVELLAEAHRATRDEGEAQFWRCEAALTGLLKMLELLRHMLSSFFTIAVRGFPSCDILLMT